MGGFVFPAFYFENRKVIGSAQTSWNVIFPLPTSRSHFLFTFIPLCGRTSFPSYWHDEQGALTKPGIITSEWTDTRLQVCILPSCPTGLGILSHMQTTTWTTVYLPCIEQKCFSFGRTNDNRTQCFLHWNSVALHRLSLSGIRKGSCDLTSQAGLFSRSKSCFYLIFCGFALVVEKYIKWAGANVCSSWEMEWVLVVFEYWMPLIPCIVAHKQSVIVCIQYPTKGELICHPNITADQTLNVFIGVKSISCFSEPSRHGLLTIHQWISLRETFFHWSTSWFLVSLNCTPIHKVKLQLPRFFGLAIGCVQ